MLALAPIPLWSSEMPSALGKVSNDDTGAVRWVPMVAGLENLLGAPAEWPPGVSVKSVRYGSKRVPALVSIPSRSIW